MVIQASDFNDDRELLRQIQLKNKSVYAAFYKKHYKSFHALAYNYVRRHEIAEEIVNDIFIKIWNKAEDLNISLSFKNYIVRSIVNASINYLKKEKVDAQKQEKYSLWNAETENFEEDKEERELILIRLEKALELLPPQCKKVMMMSRFEKLKQQEIADRLGISIKTVKNHLTYGFAKIREGLAAEGIVFCLVLLSVLLTLTGK